MSLLTVKNLSLGYDSREIVKNLNFTVDEGDYLCIVGENGSGKTTLMKTLLHLQPPISGEILYGDGLKSGQIGYLPQQTQVQRDFPASVMEIVLSGCQGRLGKHPFYSSSDKALARQNLARMGIAGLEKQSYRELSGGQQQRVLLSRALCAAGKILLLDEPVTGLDPAAARSMYELIADLNRDGITIIMISHDVAAVMDYATHILHIGEHIFFGTIQEYLDSDTGRRTLNMMEGGETL